MSHFFQSGERQYRYDYYIIFKQTNQEKQRRVIRCITMMQRHELFCYKFRHFLHNASRKWHINSQLISLIVLYSLLLYGVWTKTQDGPRYYNQRMELRYQFFGTLPPYEDFFGHNGDSTILHNNFLTVSMFSSVIDVLSHY